MVLPPMMAHRLFCHSFQKGHLMDFDAICNLVAGWLTLPELFVMGMLW